MSDTPRSKLCQACGREFFKGRNDSGKKWANRIVCSRGCRNTLYPGTKPVEERFWNKVDRSGGSDACWPWLASCDSFGYGRFYDGKRVDGSNRVAWVLANGSLPDGDGHHGSCILHRCDNPKCCNPAHLFVGSIKDNNSDTAQKLRHGRAKLSVEQVLEIRALSDQGVIQRVLAERFQVAPALIHFIVTRKIWKHI